MYEDIDFEIVECKHENNVVCIKLRIEKTFKKYYTFCLGLEIFNKMNMEELELLAYKHALQKINAEKVDDVKLNSKIDEFTKRINLYNEKIKT